MKTTEDHTTQLRNWLRRTKWSKRRRYAEAAALADEIHYNCKIGSLADHNIWASRFYHYPWDTFDLICQNGCNYEETIYALAGPVRERTIKKLKAAQRRYERHRKVIVEFIFGQ